MREPVEITVFYVGASLLGPLRKAEREIDKPGELDLRLAIYNCGAPLTDDEWLEAARRLSTSQIVFVIHVTDGDNSSRIAAALDKHRDSHNAVVALNCMPELMRRTRMGKLDFATLMKSSKKKSGETGPGASGRVESEPSSERSGPGLARRLASWMSDVLKKGGGSRGKRRASRDQYLRLISKAPRVLRFVPGAGRMADIKNYLLLFCYFIQPTPGNIKAMLLYAVSRYVPKRGALKVKPPEAMPTAGIYHPDAASLFESFAAYSEWHSRRAAAGQSKSQLDPRTTIGLLLMRPQIVSDSRRHYDELIRAIERHGLAVISALSTLMDNRDACERFFVKDGKARVSEIVSLTGFSFVGGPAMNDSAAAVEFLGELKIPLRSLISLDVQTIENWDASRLGVNPIQTAMQVAIPEIDGATEPFVFGGLSRAASEPAAIADRCERIAQRLARWNKLRNARREDLKLALVLFCFPPDKGNVGTAADLDVFSSVYGILERLKADGYNIEVPESADALRALVLGGNSDTWGTVANVGYRLGVD